MGAGGMLEIVRYDEWRRARAACEKGGHEGRPYESYGRHVPLETLGMNLSKPFGGNASVLPFSALW